MRSSSNSTAADRRARSTPAALASLAALALSCERPATQIAFRVLADDLVPAWCDAPAYRNDPRCPAGAYRVEQVLVRVCRGGPCRSPESLTCVDGDLFCRTYVDGPRPTTFNLLPGEVTVAPADPDAPGRVGISVVAAVRVPGVGADPPSREYIPRRFVVPFVPETTQLVEVWLTSLCIGAVCPPETTCGRRSCERVDGPPTQPYTPLPAPGPADAGDRDVSFDVRPRDAAGDVAEDVGLDAMDAAVAMDATDAMDAMDVMDASEATDALDATDAADAAPDGRGDAGPDTVTMTGDIVMLPDDVGSEDAAPTMSAAAGASSVGAGGHHTCLVARGSVWCWGKNEAYRLDVADPFGAAPSRVALPTPVQLVAVGTEHSCAWSPGLGSAYCWGRNDEAQLGGGTAGHEPMRVAVAGVPNPLDVAVGNRFTCAIARGGAVHCWGANDVGQCGAAGADPVVTPRPVPGVTGAQRVVAGAAHACALLGDGAVVCWGDNRQAQLGRAASASGAPAPVAMLPAASALFAGARHTCAIAGTSVYCWGATDRLRLGAARPTAAEPVPQVVPSLTVGAGASGAAGDDASCVVAGASGAVTCWGAGAFGQLGHARGSIGEAAPTAGPVQGISAALGVSVGARHACARTAAGVFCWGSDLWGQRGAGRASRPRAESAPVTVPGASGAVSVLAAGGAHACAIVRGQAYCWGDGRDGQLGNGQTANAASPVAVARVGGGGSPTALCAGDRHTCMVYGTDVWCWGSNAAGQLGASGVDGASAVPVQVTGLPGAAAEVSCGARHTCARLLDAPDGPVWCWGDNAQSQLGVTGVTSRAAPAVVPDVTARALASSAATTCALQADGSVACWGDGMFGELGDGASGPPRATPTAVAGVTGATGLTGGLRHLCAWRAAEALCWGPNDATQLGRAVPGVPLTPRAPVAVPSLVAPVAALVAGAKHTCALHGGGLSCWGANQSGESGVAIAPGGVNNVTAPTAVSLGAAATAIAAGGRGGGFGAPPDTAFTCAASGAGLRCWGSDEYGELGDGAAFSAAPVEVMLPAP
ncbi:MAG: hypothetical protein U0324_45295 [Polyangiales bacterium]